MESPFDCCCRLNKPISKTCQYKKEGFCNGQLSMV
jgi:hypothetical protein